MNTILIGAVGLAAMFGQDKVASADAVVASSETPAVNSIDESLGARIDARAFFDLLVDRYRALSSYSDLTNVVQIIRQPSFSADPADPTEDEPHRIESRLICDILDGELSIITPGSQLRDQLRRAIGLNVKVGVSETEDSSVEDTESATSAQHPALAYQLWLAPHMSLRFADEPLRDFRAGVPEGFTATEAAPVTIDERVMVHVELKSGDGASEHVDAKFDLYVNPESMLIERIDGRQRLPDGSSFETTVTITPMSVATWSGGADEEAAPDHPPMEDDGPFAPGSAPEVATPQMPAPAANDDADEGDHGEESSDDWPIPDDGADASEHEAPDPPPDHLPAGPYVPN